MLWVLIGVIATLMVVAVWNMIVAVRPIDDCVEIQTLWRVCGWCHKGEESVLNVSYRMSFIPARTAMDAARQYGERIREDGWWVGSVETIHAVGTTTVSVSH